MHRDMKPSNIMITTNGEVKILDFGIVKKQGQGDAKLTRAGGYVGTASYASPERARMEDEDFRGDIFSLGLLFYKCLTGRTAIKGSDPHKIMLMHAAHGFKVPDLAMDNPLLTSDPRYDQLMKILRKAADDKTETRYASYDEFIQDLAQL